MRYGFSEVLVSSTGLYLMVFLFLKAVYLQDAGSLEAVFVA